MADNRRELPTKKGHNYSPAEKAALARDVYQTCFHSLGTFISEDEPTARVTGGIIYLLGAILTGDGVDLRDEFWETFETFLEKTFPKNHAVWQFVETVPYLPEDQS